VRRGLRRGELRHEQHRVRASGAAGHGIREADERAHGGALRPPRRGWCQRNQRGQRGAG
jgi:hypothetical protein